MSIFNVCVDCRCIFKLEQNICPKCGIKLSAQGKMFKVVIESGGRRFTKIVAKSLTAARLKEAELKTKLMHGEEPQQEAAKKTLDQAFDNYYQNNNIKNMEHLRWDYERHIKQRFGHYPLVKITPALVEAFKYELMQKLSPKTTKNIIMIISAVFNFARRMGFQGANPLERVQKPKIKNEVMNLLTDAARERLIKVLDSHTIRVQALAIKLLIFTGLRIGEALKLEWADVDFERRSLYIREAKSGYNESIPLNEGAIKILMEAKALSLESALVFPSPEGKIFHKINQFWNSVKKAANLPEKFRLHDVRHDFATRLANTGEVSLQMIGRLLRHRSTAMTQRYAHLVDSSLRQATEKIK